ncbi:MAG: tetratricopeptide repeat protein [Candidatus Eisenbacteria bacterium]|uniref:Tetratricopeptide repeat protein n=1 Tax=Eiseniibacteriota bacterium TaxID=2212470 RepID=A0A956LY74_UNCEI|nr:tetratricopeptide repeat protein [Candidatus Eisenbacteria bacterium]
MRWLGLFFPLVLLVVVGALYLGSGDNDRLPDDTLAVWDNPTITTSDPGGVMWGRFYNMDTESRPVVRPIATLAHRLEFLAFHQDRRSYQWLLLGLHGLVGIGLFALFWRQFRSPLPAFAAGLVFVAHPALSSSVLELPGISEVLALWWGILSLLCADRALDPSREEPGRPWSVLAALFVLLAIWSKEAAAILIPTLLVWSWASRQESPTQTGSSRSSRLSAGAWLSIGVIVVGVVMMAHRLVSWQTMPASINAPAIMPDSGEPWGRRLVLGVAAIPTYLRLVFFPAKLAYTYDFAHDWAGPKLMLQVASGLLVVAALAAGTVFAVARRASRAALWLGFALFTVIGATGAVAPIGDYVSERMLYFLLPGVLGIALLAHQRWIAPRGEIWSAATFVLAILIAGGLGFRSLLRERDFRSLETLVDAQLEQHPNSAIAEYERGNQYLTRGQYAAARSHYDRATKLRPDLWMAWINIGASYFAQDEYGLARRAYTHALEGMDDEPAFRTAAARAHYNRGLVLMRQSENTDAAQDFEAALAVFPNHMAAHANLGFLYKNNTSYDEQAKLHLQRAYELDPDPERRKVLRDALDFIEDRAQQREEGLRRRRDAGLLPGEGIADTSGTER